MAVLRSGSGVMRLPCLSSSSYSSRPSAPSPAWRPDRGEPPAAGGGAQARRAAAPPSRGGRRRAPRPSGGRRWRSRGGGRARPSATRRPRRASRARSAARLPSGRTTATRLARPAPRAPTGCKKPIRIAPRPQCTTVDIRRPVGSCSTSTDAPTRLALLASSRLCCLCRGSHSMDGPHASVPDDLAAVRWAPRVEPGRNPAPLRDGRPGDRGRGADRRRRLRPGGPLPQHPAGDGGALGPRHLPPLRARHRPRSRAPEPGRTRTSPAPAAAGACAGATTSRRTSTSTSSAGGAVQFHQDFVAQFERARTAGEDAGHRPPDPRLPLGAGAGAAGARRAGADLRPELQGAADLPGHPDLRGGQHAGPARGQGRLGPQGGRRRLAPRHRLPLPRYGTGQGGRARARRRARPE